VDATGNRGFSTAWWLAVPAVVGLAWAATSLRPFTLPALAVTLLTGFAVIAVGSRVRKAHPLDRSPTNLPGLNLWSVLMAAMAIWELIAFVQLPRVDYPTLSSLANQVFDSHVVRAAAFAVWVAAGYGIARR
jgi:hypothetical protein